MNAASRSQKLLPLTAGVLILVASIVVILRLRPPESVESAVRNCYDAFRANNAAELWRYMPEAERAKLNCKADQWQEFVTWCHERTKGLEQSGTPRIEGSAASGTLVGEWFLKATDGNECSVYLMAYSDSDGPHVFVSNAIFIAAAQARYMSTYPANTLVQRSWGAVARAIDREPGLKSIGLPGVVNSNGDASLLTWDVLAKYARRVADGAREADTPKTP